MEVAGAQRQRVGLAAGAAAQQQRHAALARVQDHGDLGRRLVGAVDDRGIGTAQHLHHVIGRDEFVDTGHGAGRVDLADALRHGLDLGLPQRVRQRMDLAVDVGFGDMVQVDQGQGAHAATRQRFGGPGADAAQARHRDMGPAQGGRRIRAIQTGQAAEAAFGIGLAGRRDHRRLRVHGRHFPMPAPTRDDRPDSPPRRLRCTYDTLPRRKPPPGQDMPTARLAPTAAKCRQLAATCAIQAAYLAPCAPERARRAARHRPKLGTE
ncbi:Uncharacterised protein [Bordetella pertussis]|nr:Uncharacterised protein [Bordetella pertussis]